MRKNEDQPDIRNQPKHFKFLVPFNFFLSPLAKSLLYRGPYFIKHLMPYLEHSRCSICVKRTN